MPTDIRLDIHILDHFKTHKLIAKLGPGSFMNLLRLWMFCRSKRPKGILTNMDKHDIEIAAGWEGEPLAFTNALIDFRWLDEDSGTYKIHDWELHQPWAVGQEERSQQAKEAARVRWDREKKSPNKAQPAGDNGLCFYPSCSNPANITILGRSTCSIPKHRNALMGSILK